MSWDVRLSAQTSVAVTPCAMAALSEEWPLARSSPRPRFVPFRPRETPLASTTARSVGATSKFAGSGGAIVGTYKDEDMYQKLLKALAAVGVAVIKPKVLDAKS